MQSAEKTIEFTPRVCPSKVITKLQLCASHTRIVSSSEPDIIFVPSAEKATEFTPRVCPLNVFISLPLCASHIRTV